MPDSPARTPRSRRIGLGSTAWAVLLALWLAPTALAQDPPTSVLPQQGETVDADKIDAQRKIVEGDTSLADDVRKQALSILDEARAHLTQEAEWRERRRQLQATVDGAKDKIDEVAALVAQPKAEPRIDVDFNSSLADLDGELATRRSARQTAKDALQRIEQEQQQIESRRQEIPKQLEDARTERAEVQQLLTSPPASDEPPAVAQCRRYRQRARLQRVDALLAELTLELASLDAIKQLAKARADEQSYRLAGIDAEIERLQQIAKDKRREAIDQDEREASDARDRIARQIERARAAGAEALAKAWEKVADVAKENIDLVARRRQVIAERDDLTDVRSLLEKQHSQLKKDFDAARGRVDKVGLSEAIGLELRQIRRGRLNEIEATQRRNRDLPRRQTQAYEAYFRSEDSLEELADLDAAVRDRLEQTAVPADDRERVGAVVRQLLDERARYQRALSEAYEQLTSDYSQIDTEQQVLRSLAKDCATFIDERVLWIPSTRPIWDAEVSRQIEATREILATSRTSFAALVDAARERLLAVIGALLAIAALVVARPWLRRRLGVQAAAAAHRATTSFTPTARALVDTLLLALPVPLILCTAALVAGHEDAAVPLRAAFFDAAVTMFALAMVRELVRPQGLGEAHFDWEGELLLQVRRGLRWLAPILVVTAFVLSSLSGFAIQERLSTVGRIVLLLPLVALAIFLARILHPSRGGLIAHAERARLGRRTRIGIFLLGLGIPIALGVLALLGYSFTAIELYTRFNLTLVVALGSLLLTSLVNRWLLLSRRTLAIQQARERRRILKEQGADASAELEQQAVDLAAVDQQTRSLVRTAAIFLLVIGTWAIWVDVLPALGILREVKLWDETIQVTESVQNADGLAQVRTVDRLQPITLASLLLALILLLGTFVLSRNLGGLLEIVMLRHLKVQAGERYAITTITRYTIVAVGVLVAFGSIGLGWSKVQWLIAAISVGLGFGLQEIFANFVSGLILLFERPVRVGDLVTVGETDGRVSRIRMRATTITDFDRKELVVPNREFITSRFVNWSLSNPISRIVVKVGVAYGTDTAKAQRLLLECARKCRTVLRDPEPNTVFRGFGDNTLDLELRVFIASMDDWIDAMNEVHRTVDETFKANDIEIAFPQRDLHIRSVNGLAGPFASLEPRDTADAKAAAT